MNRLVQLIPVACIMLTVGTLFRGKVADWPGLSTKSLAAGPVGETKMANTPGEPTSVIATGKSPTVAKNFEGSRKTQTVAAKPKKTKASIAKPVATVTEGCTQHESSFSVEPTEETSCTSAENLLFAAKIPNKVGLVNEQN